MSELASDAEEPGYSPGALLMIVVGVGMSLVAAVGTVVLLIDLDELGLEGAAWRHEAWLVALVGLASFGVGLAVASLGVILGRLGSPTRAISRRHRALRAPHR